MWIQIKALLPSFMVYWVFLVVLFTLGWLGWTRMYRQFFFNWKAPVLAATVFFLYGAVSFLVNIYQNTVVAVVASQMQQQGQAGQQAQGQQQQQQPLDPALQARAELLKDVELVLREPQTLTPEWKKKFMATHEKILPKDAKARQQFVQPIYDLVGCQAIFWEDALASYKSKKVIKSEEREACEKKSGEFFNRPQLIPESVAKQNDEVIQKVSKRERLPASDGKTVEVNDTQLRSAYENENRARDVLRALFE